jgi:hypothetical protein
MVDRFPFSAVTESYIPAETIGIIRPTPILTRVTKGLTVSTEISVGGLSFYGRECLLGIVIYCWELLKSINTLLELMNVSFYSTNVSGEGK